MAHDHTAESIQERLNRGPRASYIRDWVYGGIDGAVTTFAVVSGVVGADLSARVILILGFANIVADGFSMAASNYAGTKTERDAWLHHRAEEEAHVLRVPEGEREEIRQIFQAKGFEGDDLERAVTIITDDVTRWVDTMMIEEHGLPLVTRSPWISGLCTFVSFLLCGLAPLLPFLLRGAGAFIWSCAITAAVFLTIGSAKSLWSPAPWWRSSVETLAIGGAAAGIAYGAGFLLSQIVA